MLKLVSGSFHFLGAVRTTFGESRPAVPNGDMYALPSISQFFVSDWGNSLGIDSDPLKEMPASGLHI